MLTNHEPTHTQTRTQNSPIRSMRQLLTALQQYQPSSDSGGEVDAIAKLSLLYFVAEAEWQIGVQSTTVAQTLQIQKEVRVR